MNIPLSARVQRIKPSATLTLGARTNQLKAAGQDIINMSVGEPDFDTPEHIKDAARKALKDGLTKYTPVDGTPGLKQAIIQKFANENKLNYEPQQIMVSNGAKQGLFNLALALLGKGDEVIIPAPYWVSYPDMVLLADAEPVILQTGVIQSFKITPAQLEQAINPRTRLIILNSPSNPSGLAYTRAELAALGSVIVRYPKIIVATDDMYEHIYWGKEPFVNIVNACPALYDRTIVFNGASKTYAMTGWRIGYAAGTPELIKAMTNIQSQSTSNPNSIAQAAVQAALEGDQQCVRDMNSAYKERYELLFNGLNAIPGVKCLPTSGTFYCFPSVHEILKNNPQFTSDSMLADYLLNHAGVSLLPGSAFGVAGCFRLSFAIDTAALTEALARLKTALTHLPKKI